MAGRKGKSKGDGNRPQAQKAGGASRGHGRHHRLSQGAPRPIASGRRRAEKGVREGDWIRRHDDDLEETLQRERLTTTRERLQDADADDTFGAELAGARAEGVVLEVRKGSFLVELTRPPVLPDGSTPVPSVVRAEARGATQHFDLGFSSLVTAGDEVEVVVPPVQGDEEYVALLAKVRPRRAEFRRLHPSGRAIQILASNVDRVLIVASSAQPYFRPGFVDRVLACAASCQLAAGLVMNKVDLGVPEDDRELLAVYRELGVEVLETSAKTGEGLQALRTALTGMRTVLCGHSGVGKSSLLCRLAPELAGQVRIGAVSSHTRKGKHTTVHARLYRLGCGEVIDTPGVREFTPADTDRRNLWGWFPEIAALQGRCAFADCSHTVEEDCAVRQAVREGRIHPRRHESYARIHKTLPA